MLNRGVCVTATLSLLLAPRPAAAAPLQSSSQWILDYGETQCVAGREFGPADRAVTLIIKPSPNGEFYELLVARKRAGPAFAIEREGSVDFGNAPIRAWTLQYGDRKTVIDLFRIPKAQMVAARTASQVTLRIKGGTDASFALASMPALLDGLDKCTADLMDYWNHQGDKKGKISRPARGDLRSLFSSGDFPQEAMNRRQEGISRFLLLIDPQGKVAGCHVVETSGVPVFDAMGCQVIKERAKFKPALDPQGKPIRSMVTTPKIVWRLG